MDEVSRQAFEEGRWQEPPIRPSSAPLWCLKNHEYTGVGARTGFYPNWVNIYAARVHVPGHM
eukprot:SAG11_NODE_35392_length_266_cov_4.371257_1_plen_61_part_10